MEHFLNTKDPFSCQMEVFNDSLIDLRNVSVVCLIDDTSFNDPAFGNLKLVRTREHSLRHDVQVLKKGERTTAPLSDFVDIPAIPSSAKISISIFYEVFGYKRAKTQKFYYVKDSDGSGHWNPTAR